MKDKINEFLQKNGTRELSMDELDNVIGGSNYKDLTREEFLETLYWFYDVSGSNSTALDMAVEFLGVLAEMAKKVRIGCHSEGDRYFPTLVRMIYGD